MRLPFFLCAPRTRSTILFESSKYYLENALGMMRLNNHSELFLEFSQNAQFYDAKVGQMHTCEIYPLVKDDSISIHHIYPHVFKDVYERNKYKFDILKELKNRNKHVNLKGTIQLAHSIKDTVDFYSDRLFVITKRKNLLEYVLSLLTSYHIKIFHGRDNNIDRLIKILNEGIILNIVDAERITTNLLSLTNKLWSIENILKDKKIPYTIAYYEDLDSNENIKKILYNILGTDEWEKYIPSEKNILPIRIDKDFSKIIKNYDEVLDIVNKAILVK